MQLLSKALKLAPPDTPAPIFSVMLSELSVASYVHAFLCWDELGDMQSCLNQGSFRGFLLFGQAKDVNFSHLYTSIFPIL